MSRINQPCSVVECTNTIGTAGAKGMCRFHYGRHYVGKDLTIDRGIERRLIDRIEDKTERIPEAGCWIFTGSDNGKGYGSISIPGKKHPDGVHRVSWRMHKGTIPKGFLVCHVCDTPACWNPYHLFLGRHKDNNADRARKGRSVHLFGNQNPRRKLSEDQIAAIRDDKRIARLIAKDYGVCRSTISHVKNRRTWRVA